jgi:hypothetical protein
MGRKLINNSAQSCESAIENISIASGLCDTVLQTCLLDYGRRGLLQNEQDAYLAALERIKASSKVRRVMLYTIARPSLQPEAALLKPLSAEILEAFAEDIRQLGFAVSVSV